MAKFNVVGEPRPRRRYETSTVLLAIMAGAWALGSALQWWRGDDPSAVPRVVNIEEDDQDMLAATDKARRSSDQFIKALEHPARGQSGFAVKVGFQDDYGREFMWLSRLRYRDGVFSGRVSNKPNSVRSVRYGDAASVDRDKITDWMYFDGDKLEGAFTTQVMRDRLSPEQRENLDAQHHFIKDAAEREPSN